MNIEEILEIVGSRQVDFIGVVHQCGPVTQFQSKDGKSKDRRNVLITDESRKAVVLTIWGDFSNQFDLGP